MKKVVSLIVLLCMVVGLFSVQASAAGGPAMPANVLYTPVTEDSVTITWDASEGATGYNIYRRDMNVSTPEKIATIDSVGYIDTDVVAGTDYYYSVSAFNADGESARSKEALIVLANDNTVELNRFKVFTTGSRLRLGDLDGDGRTDILVCNTSRQGNYTVNGSVMYALVAYSIEGEVMWSFSLDPGFNMTGSGVTSTSSDEPVNIADLNGDGYNDVAAVCHPSKDRGTNYTGGVFLILDGRTGQIMKDTAGNDCKKNIADLNVPGLTSTGSGNGSVNSLGDCVIFANFDGRKINGESVRQHVVLKGRYQNETAFEMFDTNGNFTMTYMWRHAAAAAGQNQAMAGHTGLAVDLDGDGIDELVSNYSVYKVDTENKTLFAWWWIKTNVEMRSGAAGDLLNDSTPVYYPGTTNRITTSDHVDTVQVGYVMGNDTLNVIFGGAGPDGANSQASTFCYTWDGKFQWVSASATEPQSLNLAQFRTDARGLLLYGLDRRVRSNYPNGADGMFLIDGYDGSMLYREEDNSNDSWSSIVIRVDNWTGSYLPFCLSFNRNTEAIAWAGTDPARLEILAQNKIKPALYDGYTNKLFEMEDPSLTTQYRFMAMDICGDARTELLGYTDAGDIAIFYNDSYGEGSTEEGKLALMQSGITGVPKQQSTFMSNYSRYPTDVYFSNIEDRIPAQPRALNVDKNAAYIDWTPIIGATSYDLYRNGEKIGNFVDVGYQETNLMPGDYNYTVVAKDATGESPKSLPLTLNITTPVATTDKPVYVVNEPITVTVTTLGDVERVGLMSETGTGMAIAGGTTPVVNEDGSKTFTLTFALGSKGDRELALRTAKVGEYFSTTDVTVKFKVTDAVIAPPAPPTVEPILISASCMTATRKVNTPIVFQVKTSTAVTRVTLANETGTNLASSPAATYVDDGDVRTWTCTISFGSSGARTLGVKIAGEDRVYFDSGATVKLTISK